MKKKTYMKLKTKQSAGIPFRLFHAIFALLLLTSCRPELPGISEDDREALDKWLDNSRQTPRELISEELAAGNSLLFAQDNLFRHDSFELMKALVPLIYDSGVRKLGLFFLDSGLQEELDRLILLGEDFSSTDSPEKLLLSSNAALGYTEYRDFISYIRNFNLRIPNGDSPLRLLALGEKGKTSSIELSKALETEEEDDTPVFLWIPAADLYLLQDIPDESVKTPIILSQHGPENGMLRWNGLIESLSGSRDIRDRTFAFRTDQPPFPSWNNMSSSADTDIYIVTSFPYKAVSPIEKFITPETVSRALEFFPELKIEKPPVWAAFRMNRITAKAAKRYQKLINKAEIPVG